MLDFRKVLLAAAVAGLGLVGNASAQGVPSCTASTTQGYVAVEGTTEQLPRLTLTCTNTGTFTGPLAITLQGSVNFANQTQASPSTNLDIAATDGGDTSTTTQPGPSTILVTFATVTPGTTVFNIDGLRVNPSGLPVGSTVTVTASSSSVQIAGSGSVNAAFVAKTIGTLTVNATPVANTSACGLSATAQNPVVNVALTAGYLDAIKTGADNTNNPLYSANASSIAAKQGTRFAVTFSNLNPAGVNYYVPIALPSTGTAMSVYAAATGSTLATASTATGLTSYTQLAVSAAGTATIYVGLPATGSGNVSGEGATIPVIEVVPSVAAVTSYSTTPVSVAVSLVGAASPAYPGVGSAQTIYGGFQTTSTSGNGLLTSCSTTLLFPYVTSLSGFDTGIAITNASTGVTGVTASSGSCGVTFYGAGGTGTTAAPATYSTGTVTTGTTSSFSLVNVDPGLVGGYAVAVCNFIGAHGYAFIYTQGLGGLAADYLAPIIASGTDLYTPSAATPIGPTF
jgi:hypothetical protein